MIGMNSMRFWSNDFQKPDTQYEAKMSKLVNKVSLATAVVGTAIGISGDATSSYNLLVTGCTVLSTGLGVYFANKVTDLVDSGTVRNSHLEQKVSTE